MNIKSFLVPPISKAACSFSDEGIADSPEGIRETIFSTTMFSKLTALADFGHLLTKEPISVSAFNVNVHKNVSLLQEVTVLVNSDNILSYMDFDPGRKLSGNVAKISRPLTAVIHNKIKNKINE